ncbi:hypothetical protein [Paraliomyxa miuraensis]|uniref:hypothetical protein n=1 Tax=Paraliomyxa miuraensis TaxID=376150 RepID=UPI002254DC8E|nr:hypothetical protein [Paraliomyxa miuraensis]MCX4245516.1 hypothetical protein [Paraliomyxa miuraensis]
MARPRRARIQSTLGGLALGAFVVLSAMPRRAPAGTVAEQRARLPPPAQCEDPVEGIWKSHDFREWRRQWTIFTLEIHRIDGTPNLRGTIRNESWRGDANQSEPGACEGELRYDVSMDAEGRVESGQIQFGGIGQWRLDAVLCGEFIGGYNLDNFTGPLDPELLEFQSVNNDGGVSVNEPTVFRRIECLDAPKGEEAKIVVQPPAFYPPEEGEGRGGCGGG